MTDLPVHWVSAQLSEVTPPDAAIIYGILQPGPDVFGGVPYVRPTEIDRGQILLKELRRTTPAIAEKYKRAALKRGDVLLSIVGTIGKVAITPPELEGGNITQSSCRIRPDKRLTSTRFLAYFLRSPLATANYKEAKLGTAVPRLNLEDVRQFVMPLPPLREQRSVADKLDAVLARVDACRERLDRVPAILKKFREAVLEAAVSGRLTEEWPGPSTFRDSTLGALAQWSSGGTPSRAVKSYFGGGIPWVKTGELRESVITSTEETLTEAGLRNSSAKVFPPNTVLIAMYGATIGRVAILGIRAATNQACAAAIADPTLVSHHYLYWLLQAERAALVAKGQGGAQPNISQGVLKDHVVIVPCLLEQNEIVRRVNELLALADGLERKYRAAVDRVEKLTPALLGKAFRGELVPPDPEDEPASVLLERIRAQRAGDLVSKVQSRKRQSFGRGRPKKSSGRRRSRDS